MSELSRSLEHEHILDRPKLVPIRDLRPGTTVQVNFRIVEGRRERVQPFQGVIIRVRAGLASANITVRRIGAHGIGVERTFPLHSPRLESVQVMRRGHVRRANLYFLRERTGKATRLREKRRLRVDTPASPQAGDETEG
jgi:large subunit ribosomal protein L19